MLYGLAAAVAFGASDLGAAFVSRRIGSLLAAVISQFTGLIVLGTLYLVTQQNDRATVGQIAIVAANGIVVALAYLTFYRSLELGPVAVVDPIVAAYPAVTVGLAFVVLSERLSVPATIGVVVTLVGTLMASLERGIPYLSRRWRENRNAEQRSSGTGVTIALASMMLFGLGSFVVGESSQQIGWLTTLLVGRLVSAPVLAGVALARRRNVPRPDARGIAAAIGIGLAGFLGAAFYATGSQHELISIVAAAATASTVIVIAGGIAFFRDRPLVSQLVGAALVVVGLVLLGAA